MSETMGEAITAETLEAPPQAVDADGRPDPQWVRGTCPECGDDLVSNLYYVRGRGYFILWECWSKLSKPAGDPARCEYSRRL